MFKSVIQKFLISKTIAQVVAWLNDLLKLLGPDGSKTVVGVIGMTLSLSIQLFPQAAFILEPLFNAIQSAFGFTPAQITTGSLAYVVIGLIHKALKWTKEKIESKK